MVLGDTFQLVILPPCMPQAAGNKGGSGLTAIALPGFLFAVEPPLPQHRWPAVGTSPLSEIACKQ